MSGAFIGAVAVLAGTATAATYLVRRRWTVVRIRGDSMAPALRDGDVVLARRWGGRAERPPGRGDVVIIRRPAGAALPADAVPVVDPAGGRPRAPVPRWLVKRIAAVGGDRLPSGIPYAGAVVPAGTVVVLGDREGFDSRLFGPVAVGSIHATVVRKVSGQAG